MHAVLLGAAATAAVAVAGGRSFAGAPPRGEIDHLVILLRPPDLDELTREALARITGELAAARFRVVVFPLDVAADPIEQVDGVGGDLAPVAAFALVRAPEGYGGANELWISDRLAHRTTIQRMRIQDGDVSRAAEVLAVESVELIRVSLAALWPRPAPPPEPPVVVERPEPPPRAELSLSVGVGVLADASSATRLVSPVARLAYAWPGGLGLFIAGRGLGSQVDLAETDGSARVRREAGWLGLAKLFRPGRRLQPMLSLGAGAEHLRAEGSASDATQAHVRTAWSALASVGAGLSATVVRHVALVVDAEGMMFWPPVVVRIGSTDAARFDRPSVLIDAGLRASF
jgi:hypothetical protein